MNSLYTTQDIIVSKVFFKISYHCDINVILKQRKSADYYV